MEFDHVIEQSINTKPLFYSENTIASVKDLSTIQFDLLWRIRFIMMFCETLFGLYFLGRYLIITFKFKAQKVLLPLLYLYLKIE